MNADKMLERLKAWLTEYRDENHEYIKVRPEDDFTLGRYQAYRRALEKIAEIEKESE